MITLSVSNLHWIKPSDEPTDMCAHGEVTFTIGDQILSSPEDGDWCVSAGALHLLRTLSRSHTNENPVAEHLIPCCGHTIVSAESGPKDWDTCDDDVFIIGCNRGVDWQIFHRECGLDFVAGDSKPSCIPMAEWTIAVCEFADTVRDFYNASAPKTPSDEFEELGFTLMMREWSRRRTAASLK